MNAQKRELVITRARALLEYGFTPIGAVRAYCYFYRQPSNDAVVHQLAAIVKPPKARRIPHAEVAGGVAIAAPEPA